MSKNRPLFSIVMPTFNRSSLLALAIRSVLEQTVADLEIIVSNGGSTDNTREVVASFDDPRIKYFESETRLTIGDNYQTGLDNAAGEYITFLSDDDAFVPVMLERVQRVIEENRAELVAFRVAKYFHGEDIAFNRRVAANTLIIERFDGVVTKYDTSDAVRQLFGRNGLNDRALDDRFIVSYLANAVYHRSVFERLKAKKDKLFATTPADLYLAAAVFFVTDHYYCLDEPLHVWSSWGDNATASTHKKGDKLREHYEKLLNGRSLEYTPLKFALPQNCVVNALLEARNDFASDRDEAKIDWAIYYAAAYEDLIYLRSLGVKVDDELQEFERALNRESIEVQTFVRSRTGSFQFKLKQIVRRFPMMVRMAKKMIRQRKADSPIVASGDVAGFSDVIGAAAYISKKLVS